MALKKFSQEFWSDGIADSDFIGTKNGIILEAVNVDIHDEPGVVKLSKGLTLEVAGTGTTPPDEFCACALLSSDTNTYWFSYKANSGKIWKRTSAGVWSLVHTIADCLIINGCGEHVRGGVAYIYYSYVVASTGADVLARKVLPGLANWTDAIDTVAGGANALKSAFFHPMVQNSIFLVVGNATTLATVDDVGTFTASGTPDVTTLGYLPIPWQITSLINYDDDVLAGAGRYTGVQNYDYSAGQLLRWDLSSATWTQIKQVNSEGVQAIVKTDNGTFIFTGNKGLIMTYDGTNLYPFKRLRKAEGLEDLANSGYNIFPYAVANYHNYALFGLSGQANMTQGYEQGVYSLGRRTTQYPLAVTLQYTEPCFVVGGQNTFHTTNISFGAIVSTGISFLVSYIDSNSSNSAVGVALMQTSKRAGAGWIALNIEGSKERSKTFTDFILTYRSLPTLSGGGPAMVLLDYFINYNYSSLITFVTQYSDTAYNKLRLQEKIEASSLQLRIYFYGDTTKDDSPSLTSLYCQWNERETL